MNDHNETWNRLARAARRAPAEQPAEAPFGFSHRVVARWLAAGPQPRLSPWELLAVRSLGLAALVMLVSLAASFNAVRAQFASEPATPAELVAYLEP